MKTRIFKITTATRMFMHGADNRRRAELRPPTIRGVMRYWFRALAGGLMDLRALRKAESQVFGSTEVGQRLLVRVSPQIARWDNAPLLPHKSGRDASESPAIQTGQELTVTLSAVGIEQSPSAEQRLDLTSWAFWLAVRLGGFGQRARRGAGSLRLLEVQPALAEVAPPASTSLQRMKDLLEAGLKEAAGCVRRSFPGVHLGSDSVSSFPVLARGKAQIVVRKLAAVGEQEARKKVMELRDAVDPTHRDPAFGGIRPRLASPVHVHLEPDGTGSFIAVATWFREPRWGNAVLVESFLNTIGGTEGVEVAIP